jgi:hypothetical protein
MARERALADCANVQPGLFNRAPRVSAEAVADVMHWLAHAAGWTTAGGLRVLTNYSDREIRAIAAASRGRIISGQRGYRLTAEATIEEVNHAEAWLRSQAACMLKRAYEIRMARNKGVS